jgi:two-component system response regulator MprA
MIPTILIVDDDLKLLKMLQRTMTYENMHVLTATNGQDALQLIKVKKPDLVILDWMMPRMDGMTVIRKLREEEDKTLILMLTARDAIENRVEGLENGADDYLVKPFAPAELVARVHVLLRRVEAKPENRILEFAGIHLDPGAHEVTCNNTLVTLTNTEFKLLQLFLLNPRQVLERRQILVDVWGYDFAGDDNVLEIYIGYLRKKLEACGSPRLIHTVRSVGYVLKEE